MCLYTPAEQIPFRCKQSGIKFWFGAKESEAAVAQVMQYYNQGRLPNSPLLLNPIIHTKEGEDTYKPVGSGIIWCTALNLGIDTLKTESLERLWAQGIRTS